jgi:hypothetical protein
VGKRITGRTKPDTAGLRISFVSLSVTGAVTPKSARHSSSRATIHGSAGRLRYSDLLTDAIRHHTKASSSKTPTAQPSNRSPGHCRETISLPAPAASVAGAGSAAMFRRGSAYSPPTRDRADAGPLDAAGQ